MCETHTKLYRLSCCLSFSTAHVTWRRGNDVILNLNIWSLVLVVHLDMHSIVVSYGVWVAALVGVDCLR